MLSLRREWGPTGDPSLQRLYDELRQRYFQEGDGFAVPPSTEVTVEWSRRLTASAGVCYPTLSIIRLSTHYHRTFPDALESTLLHEMIHLIVPGHGPAFYRWMDLIRRRGGHVQRYALARSTPKGVPRWTYRCEGCGSLLKRYRRLPHGGRNYRHKACGGRLREGG